MLKFPDFSTNISSLKLSNTLVEQVPASIQHWTRLRFLDLSYNGKLKTLKNVPEGVSHLNLSYSGIKNVPDCIKALHGLQHLNLSGCRKLATLPELPPQLMFLSANDCESLESVSSHFHTPNAQLNFTNCFELGSSLTLPYPASSRFKICLVIAPNHQFRDYRVSQLLCSRIGKCELHLSSIDEAIKVYRIPRFRTEHLFIFHSDCIEQDKSISETVFEFSSKLHDFEIVECGVQNLTDEMERS
ncbi:unnamed protein product [Brassica rapa]|uniref:TIR domain-containing protein n=1 Tax=Brassica campestris TaxID=3711 RepID=A0A8D9FXY5_BRACM|nr:unnamed protein product [Brassica rapa]